MPRLQALFKSRDEPMIIYVDDTPVGTITRCGENEFIIQTDGKIPAIDHITGPSAVEAWCNIDADKPVICLNHIVLNN